MEACLFPLTDTRLCLQAEPLGRHYLLPKRAQLHPSYCLTVPDPASLASFDGHVYRQTGQSVSFMTLFISCCSLAVLFRFSVCVRSACTSSLSQFYSPSLPIQTDLAQRLRTFMSSELSGTGHLVSGIAIQLTPSLRIRLFCRFVGRWLGRSQSCC
ncbi:unnamed protein product [Protopolystoma xenopodis]|uniref:Uncharacterized protein n=1 Tax=Protopolystoma xenopodis TaxID=117903 RepID=A0A448WC23_9PLAT|nr:unnamed protein product [Protopolystoma xenopodis]